jgi:uncharacterized protein
MAFYIIPLKSQGNRDDLFIIFRPLLGLAFIGNREMVDLVKSVLTNGNFEKVNEDHNEISHFLSGIGFLEKEPEEPAPPQSNFFSPTHAVLLLTNQCQMKCIYCYASGGDLPTEDLSLESAISAIDYVHQNAIDLNRPSFNLSFHGGGEPVMAWELIQESTKYARSKSLPCKISLTSNGVWTESQCNWIIHNIDKISLSIDGPPIIQDHNRPMSDGGPSSKIVYQTLARLDNVKKAYGIRMTAISPWNTLPDSVAYLFENTLCKGIQVEPAFNKTRGSHALPNKEEADQFVDAFLRADFIARKFQRPLRYSAARVSHPVAIFCSAPFDSLIVNPRNEIVSCYEVTTSDHELAALSRYGYMDSANVVLNGNARNNLLDVISKNRDRCRDCFCYYSCAGDCYIRTLKFDREGSIKKQTERCYINKVLTRELLLRKIEEGNGVARLFQISKGNQYGL